MDSYQALYPLLPLVAVALLFFGHRAWKKRQHRLLLEKPFSEEWSEFLRRRLPVYQRLSDSQRHRLHQMIHLFLEDKTFYGCAGLNITDEIRVCIAAQACLLSLGKQGALYPKLQAILVYPTAFTTGRQAHLDDGTVADQSHITLGESWDSGRVILSWEDAEKGGSDFTDGHNVVLHEFAHQLDSASGATNGAPPLWRNNYQNWAAVFSDNFADLRQRAARGKKTVMDTYGATNEAEFFAVATETFFERPAELQEHRPELFEELQQYYQLDPREWQ